MGRLDRQSLGNTKEQEALRFLRDRGLEPIARNFRSRFGEIDLVMCDNDCLVFIEVRYRRAGRFGSAAESVDHRKQERLILAAQLFLRSRPRYAHWPLRFDVVAIDGAATETDTLEWIRDAFRPGE